VIRLEGLILGEKARLNSMFNGAEALAIARVYEKKELVNQLI